MSSISISTMVRRMIGQYDQNWNGQIDLKRPGREIERRETTHQFDRIEISTYSHRKLFERADADKNEVVTADELEAVLKTFDENEDGQLEGRKWFWNAKKELDKFEAELGESLTSRIELPTGKPPMPPIPTFPR